MQSFDYKNSSYLSAMINSSVKKSNQYKNSYYIWNSYFRLVWLRCKQLMIDLVFANNEHRIVKSGVVPVPLSDHFLVDR